ncbi:MAG: hypothetical protein JO222_03705, partial [Frankiales bacterium]|nr:hypothetical protein [Frankiales bacterium]
MPGRRSIVIAVVLTLLTLGTGGSAVLVLLHRHGGHHPAAAPHRRVLPSVLPTPTGTIVEVNGAPVPTVGTTTVAAALTAAGVTVRSGRYLAVVSHRPLGSDGKPARVLVDGQP